MILDYWLWVLVLMYWVLAIAFTVLSSPRAKYGPQGHLSERRPKAFNIVAVAAQLALPVLDLESSSDF